MQKRCALIVTGLVAGAVPAHALDIPEACAAFGNAEVVFIGRPQPQIQHRLVYDFGIDQARKDLIEAEDAVERYRTSIGDLQARPASPAARPHNRVRSDLELDLYLRALYAREKLMQAEAATPKPQDLVLTPMDVEVAFRGVTGSLVFLWLPAAPAPLDAGRSYLIYGDRPFAFSDIVEPTTIPRDTDSAQEDLRFLYSAAAVSGATIYGLLRFENPYSDNDPGTPLPGVKIRVSSAASVIETTTREDGSFVISGVPAGRIELDPSLPERLTIPEQYSLVRELQGGGCIAWSLRAAFNGRVRGRLFREDGQPFPQVQVDLQPLDPKQSKIVVARHAGNVRTNQFGEFEFIGQPPGTYVLGVNLSRAPTSGFPYAPTFFPGTTNREAAEPIVLGEGTEHNGLDFMVGDPLARGQLEVVLDTGDAPQTSTYACVGEPGQGGGTYPKSGDDPLLVDVVEGSLYRVEIHADTPAGHVHSEPVDFRGTPGRTVISLKPERRFDGHGNGPECGTSVFR